MLVLNTNVGSLNAQRAMSTTQYSQQTAMERLSSGNRINRASDDAAGLSITANMTAEIRGSNMAIRNLNDGISFVQTTEGAMDEIQEILQRMNELNIQNGDGTLSTVQKGYLLDEWDQLSAEIDDIVANTKFNGEAVIGATKSMVTDASGTTMTIGESTAGGFSVASGTIADVTTEIETISGARSDLGAQQNRMEHKVSNLKNISENLSAARSRIKDTDFAAESAELARTNVLQQAGMAMLSQANQAPQQILSLLQ